MSCKERFYHLATGLSETVGYLTLLLPFVATVVDRILGKLFYIKGGYPLRTHMEEGGNFRDFFDLQNIRRNPFDSHAMEDPFFRNASWSSFKPPFCLETLIQQAEVFANKNAKATPFSSKEEIITQLLCYIKKILSAHHFQRDPQAFMEAWKLKRGNTKEFRIIEDSAREFFEGILKHMPLNASV